MWPPRWPWFIWSGDRDPRLSSSCKDLEGSDGESGRVATGGGQCLQDWVGDQGGGLSSFCEDLEGSYVESCGVVGDFSRRGRVVFQDVVLAQLT